MDDSRPAAPDSRPAKAQPARTAAELFVQCLEAEGCEYVFAVPGEETMDVLEALADRPPSATSPRATSRAPRSWPTCTAA